MPSTCPHYIDLLCNFCKRPFRVKLRNILDGKTRSCGCASNKLRALSHTKHGHAGIRHGEKQTKTYTAWQNMWARCNKNNPYYLNYGGRGILIHPEWGNFENFLQDMGSSPVGKSLDRINNDEGYEMNNCRWSTDKQQANNRRQRRIK